MESAYYIGIMSGTSLDGVDAVLIDFGTEKHSLVKTFFLPYDNAIKSKLLALHHSSNDELNTAALLSNQLARIYVTAVESLLRDSTVSAQDIMAIGCHGQTVRHCPEINGGYTIQLVNAALLTELTGITVVSDFRNRDLAAGGQGAPLVPAFHQAAFMHSDQRRVIVNIGGIANLTYLDPFGEVSGFDCGPGNMLMDAWCQLHTGKPYDDNGNWAATGRFIPSLLEKFLSEDFFSTPPPKSTGRDLFNFKWLESHLQDEQPEDVQATLMQLSVTSISQAIQTFYPETDEAYLCGGGAHNLYLVNQLKKNLSVKKIALTDELGIPADWVEASAFAWLARQTILKQPGNLPAATGAKGQRILGAIHPA
ncbi:anhydro-N-acetylmuramic acid kinase [Nitrosomonas sp. Nm51]|uniref:anhydro-N-acetylmuramic acid kinase n=1 Tax=Nitrosomonas sp. Nm51 TaxID=133720 RepID=UPI0008B7E09B|nr:anhydro-N-acetylmuramic acid kinase [Nitrosomonas sp. Nm51]SER42843.1 anhydro-N-acetylmuramic acid kinase [Nitrosomonas sp. Nm51]